MNKKILLLVWVVSVAGGALNAGDTQQNLGQLQKLGGATLHYLQSAAGRMAYQPPVIDKEWRVFNETPYTLLINGNPVAPNMVLPSSEKGQTIAVADFVPDGKVHFKPFTVKLLEDTYYQKRWTRYLAITIKPGILWGLRVEQRFEEYDDEDIKTMMVTHPVLKNEPERAEWQIVNRSSYPIQVNGLELAKGESTDGKLADTDTISVKVPVTIEDSYVIAPITIDLKGYKGLLLRQRNQWLKVDIVNVALFKHGIDYKISRREHFLLWGNLFSGHWGSRWPRDAFLGAAALTLMYDRVSRIWR